MGVNKDTALPRKKQLSVESFTAKRKSKERKGKKARGRGGGRKPKRNLLAEATAVEQVVVDQPKAKIRHFVWGGRPPLSQSIYNVHAGVYARALCGGYSL